SRSPEFQSRSLLASYSSCWPCRSCVRVIVRRPSDRSCRPERLCSSDLSCSASCSSASGVPNRWSPLHRGQSKLATLAALSGNQRLRTKRSRAGSWLWRTLRLARLRLVNACGLQRPRCRPVRQCRTSCPTTEERADRTSRVNLPIRTAKGPVRATINKWMFIRAAFNKRMDAPLSQPGTPNNSSRREGSFQIAEVGDERVRRGNCRLRESVRGSPPPVRLRGQHDPDKSTADRRAGDSRVLVALVPTCLG